MGEGSMARVGMGRERIMFEEDGRQGMGRDGREGMESEVMMSEEDGRQVMVGMVGKGWIGKEWWLQRVEGRKWVWGGGKGGEVVGCGERNGGKGMERGECGYQKVGLGVGRLKKGMV